jgi:hypothetical protein
VSSHAAPPDATGCCPRFEPEAWDGKVLTWDRRPFLRDHVRCLLHIPLGFGRLMVRDLARIEAAGVKDPAMLVLADGVSAWGMDLLLGTTGDLPDADMVHLSGRFVAKVFEGPYHHEGRWRRDFDAWLKGRGEQARKVYAWYTTCPKCAKAYGKNYVVLIAET